MYKNDIVNQFQIKHMEKHILEKSYNSSLSGDDFHFWS